MLVPYEKPALSFEAQIELLRSRGMAVGDPEAAMRRLSVISYYRLSAYAYPFREVGSDGFAPGTSFERVIDLYEFDRRLRLVLLDAIERVEVAVRTAITYEFARRHGPFGHLDAANLEAWFRLDEWRTRLERELVQSRETFIEHFKARYEGFPRVPLWMATEVMSFGALVQFFKGCRRETRVAIAAPFGIHESVFASWILSLSYVRNLCAHHARVWNRDLALTPKLPERGTAWRSPELANPRRAFSVVLVLRAMMRALHIEGDWPERLTAQAGDGLSSPFIAQGIGATSAWREHPIWRGR